MEDYSCRPHSGQGCISSHTISMGAPLTFTIGYWMKSVLRLCRLSLMSECVRMVLQELSRGVSIIRLRRGYSRWHQADWFLKAASS